MTPEQQKADLLAQKILFHSRRLITGKAPFLLEAVYVFTDQPTDSGSALFSDGRSLYYDPTQVITDFQTDRNSIARQLLHVTAHCLLEHLPQRREFTDDKETFDAAADMKAAQLASLSCGDGFAHHSQNGNSSVNYDHLPHLPLLCQSIRTARHNRYKQYKTLAAAARFDQHDRWHSHPTLLASIGSDGNVTSDKNAPDWTKILSDMASQQHSSLPGNLQGLLQEQIVADASDISYGDFLRRFAAPQERMLTDPDSIDPRWYHLGLSYYGNIPLLEEAEISEPPVPDDLVIALDTSGSCSGDVCKIFLQETLGILRDISAGAPRFRITLMQCDTEIQSVDILESPQQVEELFDHFTAKGFGGTDFCPVFEKIDAMRTDGSLPRVRGLLYLSDTHGCFPDHPPDYPTVFLIPAVDQIGYSQVPEWITCLYFDHENFTIKEANT